LAVLFKSINRQDASLTNFVKCVSSRERFARLHKQISSRNLLSEFCDKLQKSR
jgi:hypothetical protein